MCIIVKAVLKSPFDWLLVKLTVSNRKSLGHLLNTAAEVRLACFIGQVDARIIYDTDCCHVSLSSVIVHHPLSGNSNLFLLAFV